MKTFYTTVFGEWLAWIAVAVLSLNIYGGIPNEEFDQDQQRLEPSKPTAPDKTEEQLNDSQATSFNRRPLASGYSMHLTVGAFDISKVKNNPIFLKRLMGVFKGQIHKVFKDRPISATDRSKGRMPQDEIRLERTYEKSLVLEGFAGPYYECSTYHIRWWVESDNLPGIGFSAPDREQYIYVEIGQSLTIGVGKKGEFKEPTEAQWEEYRKAVASAFQTVVENTCVVLKGTLNSNCCKLKVEARRKV